MIMFNCDDWILEHQNPMVSLKKWQTTVDLIAKLYDAPAAYIIQYTSKGFQVIIGNKGFSTPYQARCKFYKQDDLFNATVVDSCGPLYVNNAANNPHWKQDTLVQQHRVNSYLGVPVYWPDGSAFGTICVLDYAVTHYNTTFQELLWQFRDLLEADLLLNNQFRQLLELSTKDDLSHLLNRRGFFLQAEKHLRLAQRLSQSIGILYLDLDNLKTINDKYGHRIGDKAICALSSAVQGVLRDSDVAGRIGGDEFVVVMMTQNEQALNKLSERIRTELNNQCVGELESLQLRVSIGSGLFKPTDNRSIDRMVSEVDSFMYQDKQTHMKELGTG